MLTYREISLIIASTAIAFYVNKNPSDSLLAELSKYDFITSLCDDLKNAAVDESNLSDMLTDTSLCVDYLSRWIEATGVAILILAINVNTIDGISSFVRNLMEKINTAFNPQDETGNIHNITNGC